jgi:hypothetical protein
VSNGKPIKEILPEVIRKLIIQRKHYLKQQRINRRKKNRDPNQPKLPGMQQGGNVATDYSKRVSKETYEEAKKDVGDIKGKAHHLKAHKKEGEKRLKELRKKQNWTFVPEKVLKEVYPQRDKGWGGKHSRKIEHNAKGGRVGLKDGKSIAAKTLVAGFVGKAKDWPGAKAVKKLNKKGKTRK